MSSDNLPKITEDVKRQLDKHSRLNLRKIRKLSDKQKEPLIRITVSNQKISIVKFGVVKKNRINALMLLIKETVKKYPQINTTFYININDWTPKDLQDLPIFVMSAHY